MASQNGRSLDLWEDPGSLGYYLVGNLSIRNIFTELCEHEK